MDDQMPAPARPMRISAGSLNAYFREHGSLPTRLADSELASEARGLPGLLSEVERLLLYCS